MIQLPIIPYDKETTETQLLTPKNQPDYGFTTIRHRSSVQSILESLASNMTIPINKKISNHSFKECISVLDSEIHETQKSPD